MNVPRAALVIIGQELLSGKVKDENVGYLTEQLWALGVEVKRVLFVPDDSQDIVEALRWVVDRHDYVFTTGGMGPTHDDVTVAAVSEALGRPMVHSPSLESLLERLYGVPAGPERTRLCHIPEGAELVYPEDARFPQLIVGNVFLFPGVPSIVRKKFSAIAERFRAEPIYSERLDLDRSEMEIVMPLNAVVESFADVRFGSYPQYSEGKETVYLTLDGTQQERVQDALKLLKKLLGLA
ncbi:MAG: competence/damage-inducible protein A [Candidatus Eremiobacteraeota bacterium]|nr:competence/damage-inducible protein A [Candidatus Eremiobacteraeota bacterium]